MIDIFVVMILRIIQKNTGEKEKEKNLSPVSSSSSRFFNNLFACSGRRPNNFSSTSNQAVE